MITEKGLHCIAGAVAVSPSDSLSVQFHRKCNCVDGGPGLGGLVSSPPLAPAEHGKLATPRVSAVPLLC